MIHRLWQEISLIICHDIKFYLSHKIINIGLSFAFTNFISLRAIFSKDGGSEALNSLRCPQWSLQGLFSWWYALSTFYCTMLPFLNWLGGVSMLSAQICPNSMGGCHKLLIWPNELYSGKILVKETLLHDIHLEYMKDYGSGIK